MGYSSFFHHYLVFASGLLLLVMASYSFLMPRGFAKQFGWSWNLLGVFGACFAAYVWGEITEQHFHWLPLLWSNTAMMTVSAAALFEFARRSLRANHSALGSAWVYAVVLFIALDAWSGAKGFHFILTLSFSLAFLGSLMAAAAMLTSAHHIKAAEGAHSRMSTVRRGLRIAALSLALWSLTFLNDIFPGLFGLGHQAVHSFSVLLVFILLFAMTMIHGCYIFDQAEHRWNGFWGKHRGFVYLLALVPSLVGGFFIVERMAFTGITIDSRELHISSEIVYERISNDARTVRALVRTLAQSPNLSDIGPQSDPARINSTLDRYAAVVEGSVCYVLDLKGHAIASSNRAANDSFVGNNYAIRPYFKEALASGYGEYSAMGLTSRLPGFYASAALHSPDGQVIGVAVVKAPLGISLNKTVSGVQSLLVHSSGVILASSSPEMVFKFLWPVSGSDRQALVKSKQFPVMPASTAALLPRHPDSKDIEPWQDTEALFYFQPTGLKGVDIVTVRRPHDFYVWQIWGFGGLLFFYVLGFIVVLWNEFMQRNRVIMRERERRLAEQAQQMETIFNSTQVGLLLVDSALKVKRLNQVVLDLGGQDISVIMGRQPGDALSCIQAKETAEGCGGADECKDCPVRGTAKMILQTGNSVRGAEVSRTIRTASGEHKQVWWEVNATPLDIGGERHILFSLADITARREADRVIRESSSRLDIALKASKMGTWHWDIVRNYRYWDEQTHKIIGTDPAAFKGSGEEFMKALHPEDRETVKAALARAVKDGTYDVEYRVIWPNGSTHHIHSRGTTFYERAGKPLELSGVLWDVTDQKLAEENRARHTKELEVFYKASIGREERILDLKKEVDRLKKELGQSA